jgi:uncharacterized protein YcaQ
VLIARRAGTRRYYDLPGRVLPPDILNRPEPELAETRQWQTLLKLRQRRLAALGPADLKHVSSLVQRIEIEGCPSLYCLREDVPLLDAQDTPMEPMLLAPLDPLIYDRRVTAMLWGFSYTWEVYTPPAKRVRGYYALPLLIADAIVGHVDPKADRSQKKLMIMNRSVRRGHRASPAIKSLAKFLGLKKSCRNDQSKKTPQRFLVERS